MFPLASVQMAYRKVCDAQAGPLVAETLHCSAGLDLDWNLDKEEPQEAAASMERVQMQHKEELQRSGEDFLLVARGRSLTHSCQSAFHVRVPFVPETNTTNFKGLECKK